MSHTLQVLTSVALFATASIGQTTWVVSMNGGGHFTDIPPAALRCDYRYR